MRFALLATTSLVALALASYACSSSDDKGTSTPDAGSKSSSSSGSADDDDDTKSDDDTTGDDDDNTSSSGSTSSGGSSSGDSGASSSGSTSGSTTSSSGSPVDGGDTAGTKCQAGDQQETSANNDTEANAQVLTATTGTAHTSFCGRNTAGDNDWFSYTFNVTGAFSYSGGASFSGTAPSVKIKVGGTEHDFSESNIPVQAGQPVLFHISGPNQVDYRITFDITQH